MFFRPLLFLIIQIAFCTNAYAEDTTSITQKLFKPKNASFDTLYVKSFADKLNIALILEAGGHSINVGGQGVNYDMRVNRPATIGLGIDRKWLGFEVRIPAFWRPDNPNKGDARSLGLRLNINGRKHSIVSFLRRYQNFYLHNISEFQSDYLLTHRGVYPQRTDLITTNMYNRWIYVFNGDRYSTRAALRQSEKQKKSTGSFMLGAVLAYQAMRADSSIVADSLERAFPTVKDVRGYRLGVLGITGGYGFSLKIGRNFFINGKMLLGITREFGRYLDNNGERISGNRKMGTSSEFNVGIGSNGNRFYWELSALAYTLSNPFDQVNYFTTNFNSLRLHAGYRFDYKPGKFMRKLGL